MRHAFFKAAVAHTHALLSHARWVAGSPVAFMVATLRWPPVRSAAGLDFEWGAEAWEGRHLVSSGGLFAFRHERTRPLSSTWGDRIMTAQQ